jgi:hypothetical protein
MIVSAVKKAKMNFTQSMGFAGLLLPLPYTLLSFACRCHEISLIPVVFVLKARPFSECFISNWWIAVSNCFNCSVLYS